MWKKAAILGLAACAVMVASATAPVTDPVRAQALDAQRDKASGSATTKRAGAKAAAPKAAITKGPTVTKAPAVRTITRKTPAVSKAPSIVAKKRPPVIAKKPPVVAKRPPVIAKKPPLVAKRPPLVVKRPPVIAGPPHYRRWRPGHRWRWIVVPTIIIAEYLEWCHYHLYPVPWMRFHRNIECHQHDWWDHPSIRYVEAY
jgi:hypothetical protein